MNVYRIDDERARREKEQKERERQQRQHRSGPPVFNLPGIIVVFGGVLAAIHVARTLLLPVTWDNWTIYYFAFWPAKYTAAGLAALTPFDLMSSVWAFLSYSLLHGSAMHIIFNLLWMAIFGSALARRFGAARFLAFSALCSIGGACAHLLTHWGEAAPMIGASAVVSGHMAASIRFVFEHGGPLGTFRRSDPGAYYVPGTTAGGMLSQPPGPGIRRDLVWSEPDIRIPERPCRRAGCKHRLAGPYWRLCRRPGAVPGP